MKWHRIKTGLLYVGYHFTHSVETWVDIIWFPFINVLVFGFLASLFGQSLTHFTAALLIGLIFWETLRAVQYGITVGMLWDIWSRSFSTLFVSSLTIYEFILAQAIGGTLKAVAIFIFLSFTSLLFKVNILVLGFPLLVYFSICALFATVLGVFVMTLILRYGTDIQSLAWSLIYVLQPISAIFYPVEALPAAIQPLSYFSPITYVMQSVRSQLTTGEVLWRDIGLAYLLTFVYAVFFFTLFQKVYARSKRTGSFARMTM